MSKTRTELAWTLSDTTEQKKAVKALREARKIIKQGPIDLYRFENGKWSWALETSPIGQQLRADGPRSKPPVGSRCKGRGTCRARHASIIVATQFSACHDLLMNTTTQPNAETTIKYTCDRRPVYPAGSALPAGASGWTQCKLQSAGYVTWLRAEDIAQSKADLAQITAEARELRRKSQAITAIAVMGGTAYEGERLCDMRTQWINLAVARAWPLIEAP